MNIAVCDDEENIRSYIKQLVEMQNISCRMIEFSSGEELLRFWEQEDREQIDILFLDISMDGTDGMKTAEQIRDWKEEREEPMWGSLPLLIFVTGYPEYMQKAFSVNAFQYLVKPVDEKEFEDVFAQALRECRCLNRKKNRKIIVSLRGEEIECYGKISEMENELRKGFFRTHKGYLVNMKYVERYSRTEVQMKDGKRLPISKYKYQGFTKAYLEFITEDGG